MSIMNKFKAILWFLSILIKRTDKETEQFMKMLQELPEKDKKVLFDNLKQRAQKKLVK